MVEIARADPASVRDLPAAETVRVLVVEDKAANPVRHGVTVAVPAVPAVLAPAHAVKAAAARAPSTAINAAPAATSVISVRKRRCRCPK